MNRHRKKTRYSRKIHRGIRQSGTRKNIITQSASFVNDTSKKIMPKVKYGLENIGAKVVNKTVPVMQGMSRKFFGMFGSKTRKYKR